MKPLLVAAALVCVADAACAAAPADPLAKDRASLAALESTDAPAGFPAEATVLLSRQLFEREIDAALQRALQDARGTLALQLPGGVVARLVPEGMIESVRIAKSGACDACVELTVGLVGRVSPAVDGVLGVFLKPVRFFAESTATLEVVLVRVDGDRREVRARAVKDGAWRAKVELDRADPQTSQAVSELLEDNLRRLIEEGQGTELRLADVRAEGPARLRGLRARALDGAVALDFAFGVLEGGAAEAFEAPAEGWRAVVPERTVLGLARAAALRQGVVDGFAVEPTAVDLDAGRFALDVRLWKVSSADAPRSYRVTGRFALDDEGDLRIVPEQAEEIGRGRGDMDPLALIVRMSVLDRLRQSLAVVVPGAHGRDVGGRSVVIRLTRVGTERGSLVLDGVVVPAPIPAAPHTPSTAAEP